MLNHMSMPLLLIFILISPGFCLAAGMRWGSKYDLKAESEGTAQLFLLITLATISQILISPFLIWVVDKALDVNLLLLIKKQWEFFINPTNDKEIYYISWLGLITYVILNYFISCLIGYQLIRSVEEESIKIPFLHSFIYELYAREKKPNMLCSVLTKIQQNNSSVMYRGTLKEISHSKDNTVNFITLSGASRYLFRIEDGNKKYPPYNKPLIKTTELTKVSYLDGLDDDSELLYINGSEISNVLITNFPFTETTKKSGTNIASILAWTLAYVYLAFVLNIFLKDTSDAFAYALPALLISAIMAKIIYAFFFEQKK